MLVNLMSESKIEPHTFDDNKILYDKKFTNQTSRLSEFAVN